MRRDGSSYWARDSDRNMNNSMGGGWNSYNNSDPMMGNSRMQNMMPQFGMGPGPNMDPDMQTNEIASQIINAVLSSNMLGNMNNQGGPSFNDDEMEDYDRRGRRSSRYSPPRRSRRHDTDEDRFSRDRRRSPPRRPRERSESRRTSVRGRLSYKRARLSKSPVRSRRPVSERPRDRSRERIRNTSGKTKNADGDTPKEPLPSQALFCHVCKHGNFASETTYLHHLDGIKHKKAAEAFADKNEATLDYLQECARLACLRFGNYDGSRKPDVCRVCTAVMHEGYSTHKNFLEHRAVQKFLSPKCCDQFYESRRKYDDHRLSLVHLRNVYNENKDRGLVMDDSSTMRKAKWSFEEAIKYLKGKNPSAEDNLSMRKAPPFDGNSFLGVKFLVPRESIQCRACTVFLPYDLETITEHVKSEEHYKEVKDVRMLKKRRGLVEERLQRDGGKVEGGEESVASSRKRRRNHDDDATDDDDDDDDVIELGDDELKELEGDGHIILEEVGEDEPLIQGSVTENNQDKEQGDQVKQGNDDNQDNEAEADQDNEDNANVDDQEKGDNEEIGQEIGDDIEEIADEGNDQ